MTGAPLRIATRKSPLALWQAEHVAARLRAAHPDVEVVLLPMSTKGDRILDRSLAAIGGKGLFIKELEVALEEHRADLAVHSMKDVPADLPANFAIGAVLERADPRDALVSARARSLEELPSGARVGTSSLRRRAQLLGLRPDLRIEALRGNLNTRIGRLDEGSLDAVVLACAGLARLGWEQRIAARLPLEVSLPAVGQGAIGVECRTGDTRILERLATLEHPPTRRSVDAERAFSRCLGGSCQSPVAAHATLDGGRLTIRGLVASTDGRRVLRDGLVGAADAAAELGEALAQRMLAAGAREILDALPED